MVSTCPEYPLINLQIPSTIQFLPTPLTFEYNIIAMFSYMAFVLCVLSNQQNNHKFSYHYIHVSINLKMDFQFVPVLLLHS